MFDGFPGTQPGHDLFKFFQAILRNQDRNRLSGNFRGGVAVNLLCASVPTNDLFVQRFADDGVSAGFDDGGEVGDLLLRLLALGYVYKGGNYPQNFSRIAVLRLGIHQHPRSAIPVWPVDADDVVSKRLPGGDHEPCRIFRNRHQGTVFPNEAPVRIQLPGEKLVRGQSEQLLGTRVAVENVALAIMQHNRRWHLLDKRPVFFLALSQGAEGL